MNRTLRRPMFRMGGSAGEGITSGLAPRQGYNTGLSVKPINFPGTQAEWEAQQKMLKEKRIGPYSEFSLAKKNKQAIVPGNTGSTIGDGTDTKSIIDRATERKSILDAVYPRTPRRDTSFNDFLISMGLDLVSRPKGGNIFQQVATSAKGPFEKFQEAKQLEDAYSMKETSEDRALLAKMLEGMDDDKLSALMKDVKAGVDAGEFPDEATGIKLLLQKKIYGVLDAPGEADQRRINQLENYIINNDDKSFGYARQVAEHMHKMQTGVYPKEVAEELNQTVVYIKPRHKARDIKPEYDDQGQITKFVVQGKFARTYGPGIYFDPDTGNLFKRVSSTGEAPVFQRVDFD